MLVIKILRAFSSNIFNANWFYGVGFYKFKYLAKILGLTSIKKSNLKLLKRKKFIYSAFKEDIFSKFVIGNSLLRKNRFYRESLNETECLRSIRFLKGLPCNGQRTQTNCRTSKRLAGLIERKGKKRYAAKKKQSS